MDLTERENAHSLGSNSSSAQEDETSCTFHSIQDYVTQLQGRRAIERILIANNGISAVKAIRSIRRWSYEMFANEHKVSFVAMTTPEDLRANAEYIRMANQVVEVPGGENHNNYANVQLIVELATRWKVDAVWAGWGHASENPKLPQALAQQDIVFIGPSSKPMQALGDKIGSTIIAQSANVPTIAWNGDNIQSFDYQAHGGLIPQAIYDQASIHDVTEARLECERIGLPVMIKASEGGGGKGIRKVTDLSEISRAFTAIQGEIPGSPIFIMKLAPESRHLEVQLLADEYGQAIALSGRDCSVQRRHQKIVEEGPVLAAPLKIWTQMERAATRLAKAVGYANAGTVEYLYTEKVGDPENPEEDEDARGGDSGRFFFLELNPRLQVEHPVTEMITGVNLPAAQLQVAMGIPLDRIPDVRRLYRQHPFGTSRIDFETEEQVPTTGHVIAARITAENPDAGFQPTSGAIEELNFRSTPDVWGYFSVDSSGRVHEYADSQIGHLFAWGQNRDQARKNIILALKELSIRGDIRTTIEYLVKMMESSDFKENRITTSWLDARIAQDVESSSKQRSHTNIEAHYDQKKRDHSILVVMAGALCMAHQEAESRIREYTLQLSRGQHPSTTCLSQKYVIELIYNQMKFVLQLYRSGAQTYTLYCNESYFQADIRMLNDGGFLLKMNGQSHVAYATKDGSGLRLIFNGSTHIFTDEYDPTRLITTAAGKLVRYLVADGSPIRQGTVYAEIEVMKMYMPLVSPEDGRIHLLKPEGSVLCPGDCLATMILDDPSCVKKAEIFHGKLPPSTDDSSYSSNSVMYQFKQTMNTFETILDGYAVPEKVVELSMQQLFQVLQDPHLPSDECKEELSKIVGRIPSELHQSISANLSSYKASVLNHLTNKNSNSLMTSTMPQFPMLEIMAHIDQHATRLKDTDTYSFGIFQSTVEPLRQVLMQYKQGMVSRQLKVMEMLFQRYIDVEQYFTNTKRKEEVIAELRRSLPKDEMIKVYDIARSHQGLSTKNSFMLRLLKQIHRILKTAIPIISSSQNQDGSNTMTSGDTGDEEARATTMHEELNNGFLSIVSRAAGLQQKAYSLVALEARFILLDQKTLSYNQRLVNVETLIWRGIQTACEIQREEIFRNLIDQSEPIFDLLISLLRKYSHVKGNAIQSKALELYVRRIYRSYCMKSIQHIHDYCLTFQFQGYSDLEEDQMPSTVVEGSKKNETPSIFHAESYDDISSLLNLSSSKNDTTSSPSLEGQQEKDGHVPLRWPRFGLMASFESIDGMMDQFSHLILPLFLKTTKTEPVHVMHCVILAEPREEQEMLLILTEFLSRSEHQLREACIRRITLTVVQSNATTNPDDNREYTYPGIYTFRQRLSYREDTLVRHMEAPLAYMLELERLSQYNVQSLASTNRNVHLYLGTARTTKTLEEHKTTRNDNTPKDRIFVRTVVHHTDRLDDFTDILQNNKSFLYDAYPGPERMFVDALNALELAMAKLSGPDQACHQNHVFLSVLPETDVHPQYIEAVIRILAIRYGDMLLRLRVGQVEFKIRAKFIESRGDHNNVRCLDASEKVVTNVRLVASNPTGFVLRVDTYVERLREFQSVGETTGDWHGLGVMSPYPVIESFDRQRERANQMSDTLYVYDFLELFEHALLRMWKRYLRERRHTSSLATSMPTKLMESIELILNPDESSPPIIECHRPPGRNSVGMVAWKLTLYTPEYPTSGRQLIVLANDITHQAGSFGTREDLLFEHVTSLARTTGIPRIYLAANSGARLGLASSVQSKYQVAWVDPSDVSKGFAYLYLTEQDYRALSPDSVVVERFTTTENNNGQDVVRYRLLDVIGTEPDLGVENLRGSGTIAGATSRANADIFTLTYVAGRSVGIGAYLVRLGQRTIQKRSEAPILLTGYEALNTLMGTKVYRSNDELGGVSIMQPNGITHESVSHHLDGVEAILRWIAYVPATRRGPLPIRDIAGVDTIEREIGFCPPPPSSSSSSVYDPRELISGKYVEELVSDDSFSVEKPSKNFLVSRSTLLPDTSHSNTPSKSATTKKWLSGFADRGSFHETLGEWAKSVVVGRARLGGIPIGVILSEVRQGSKVIPADPATPSTTEHCVAQPGQVWFPDSAFKTASAIRDFRGEDLPLFIFANWRGFSGGQRDMFDEVLKFGAMIVDELVQVEAPVFVYLPPGAELRGGAWVVIDASVQPEVMEMYADTHARGGVLEPPGLVAIKYRKKALLASAHRLDPELVQLDLALEKLKDDTASSSSGAIEDLEASIRSRESTVLGVFVQIATQFADLHDTPRRMKAKGVIRNIVPWTQARVFFYWRLRRRLVEFECQAKVMSSSGCSKVEADMTLREWFEQDMGQEQDTEERSNCCWQEEDRKVTMWFEGQRESLDNRLENLDASRVAKEVLRHVRENTKATADGLVAWLETVSTEERHAFLTTLTSS